MTANLDEDLKKELKERYSRFSKLAEASSRINLIAFDIYDHFVNYCLPKGLKAMVVCSSRATAVDMNKLHWISVLLPDAPEDVVRFLVNVSFEATKDKRKRQKNI